LEGTVSAEMRKKAMLAMLGALVGMLIYIWVRFQFIWGLAAILALAHDVIVTLGFFILFGYEADLPVVAAFLTLVGFSVNDTIVTFDRIRENLRNRGGHLSEIVNTSINQTLSRTVITSLTVFLSALCLYLFGGPVLNPFAFVMTIGIVVGTYSSIYIASPVLVIWKDWLADRAVRKSVPSKARA
jgi:preprotein translocase subunit SecF